MFCSMCMNKTFKKVCFTLIHIRCENNCMCYAFEGHINVDWGPHPALGPPVGQPCFKQYADMLALLLKLITTNI